MTNESSKINIRENTVALGAMLGWQLSFAVAY